MLADGSTGPRPQCVICEAPRVGGCKEPNSRIGVSPHRSEGWSRKRGVAPRDITCSALRPVRQQRLGTVGSKSFSAACPGDCCLLARSRRLGDVVAKVCFWESARICDGEQTDCLSWQDSADLIESRIRSWVHLEVTPLSILYLLSLGDCKMIWFSQRLR